MQELIERNMPDGYYFTLNYGIIDDYHYCSVAIYKNARLVESSNQDSLYWAIKFVLTFFENLKQ